MRQARWKKALVYQIYPGIMKDTIGSLVKKTGMKVIFLSKRENV